MKGNSRPELRINGSGRMTGNPSPTRKRVLSGLATIRPELTKSTIMLPMRSLMLLAALGFSAADCAHSRAGAVVQPGAALQGVTFCQLLKAPAEFEGKTVRIRGIYRHALEENEFEPAECCPEQPHDRFHASINGNPVYPNARSERLIGKLSAGMSAIALVVFVGTLHGHVLEVERVERIEKLSHPKDKEHEPFWARQNCQVTYTLSE
jgi:hypothetical protein